MDPWRCPACGHRHRTPRYVGNYIACDYCDEMFPAKAANPPKRREAPSSVAPKSSAAPKSPSSSSSSKKMDEPAEPSLWVRILLGDPAKAVEGAIPGAIGGLLAGITVGFMQGFIDKEVTRRVTIGLISGFGIGLGLGAIWGPYGPMARLGWKFRPVFAALFSGALIGMLIGFLIGSIQWLVLVGGAAGATGAALWALIAIKVEAGEVRPERKREEDADLAAYYDQRLKRKRTPHPHESFDSGFPGEDAYQA